MDRFCMDVRSCLTHPAAADLVRWHRAEFPLWFNLLQDALVETRRSLHLRLQLTSGDLQTHSIHIIHIQVHQYLNNLSFHVKLKQDQLVYYIYIIKFCHQSPWHVGLWHHHWTGEVWRYLQGWEEVWTGWSPGSPHVHFSLTEEEYLH